MKLPWFTRIGIIYIPRRLLGWIILLAGMVYLVYKFVDIDSRSHSVSDTLRPFIIYLVIIGAVYTLIAFLTNSLSNDMRHQSGQ